MWGRGSINQSKGEVNVTQTGNDNAQSICIIQGESFPAEKPKLLAWKSKGLNRNSGPEQQQTPGVINQGYGYRRSGSSTLPKLCIPRLWKRADPACFEAPSQGAWTAAGTSPGLRSRCSGGA